MVVSKLHRRVSAAHSVPGGRAMRCLPINRCHSMLHRCVLRSMQLYVIRLPPCILPRKALAGCHLFFCLVQAGVQSVLPKIVTTGFRAIQLIYFFTAGADEVKCWQIRKGSKAPQASCCHSV